MGTQMQYTKYKKYTLYIHMLNESYQVMKSW